MNSRLEAAEHSLSALYAASFRSRSAAASSSRALALSRSHTVSPSFICASTWFVSTFRTRAWAGVHSGRGAKPTTHSVPMARPGATSSGWPE
jgi:hypothetical protein